MTKMTLIKWLLFHIMIARAEGWKSSIYSVGQEIMKTIFESCYEGYSSPNPIVIFGEFNQLIEGISIIRFNDFFKEDYEGDESLKFKARSIVLMSEPPERLFSHLERLKSTKLWNNLIPFFIIGENRAPCTNSRIVLREMWRMEILDSIYICPNSINNRSEIYTLNPITNYAPNPWQIIDELSDLKIFRQNFDANISCTNLIYDKTKILNGYSIIAADWEYPELGVVPGRNYFDDDLTNTDQFNHRALRTIITALNASCRFELETGIDSLENRCEDGSTDIIVRMYTPSAFSDHPSLFPLLRHEMVAVMKLRAEVSTLEKICHIWSTSVLISAGFTLAIFFIILMIKRRSFGLALLDITRFLTYVSIQTNNRYQSFRIYFTTMLILIIISNGVFQSKIAAFLTTRERSSAVESVLQLAKLRYHINASPGTLWSIKENCPSCEFKEASDLSACVELVLSDTKNVCVMSKLTYETYYISYSVDRVKESFSPALTSFVPRKNWPLLERFNDMTMRVVESGLTNFWEIKGTSIPKAKRQSLEAERASAQYRPVALAKLDFAFELLAVGLSLATIVFLLELCWARYVKP